MTDVAGNIAPFAAQAANKRRVFLSTRITIGDTGAVGAQDADDPALALTRTGTGAYTLAFPRSPRGWLVGLELVSAAATVVRAGALTFAPTTGSMTFVTRDADGAAADPANGNTIQITLALDVYG